MRVWEVDVLGVGSSMEVFVLRFLTRFFRTLVMMNSKCKITKTNHKISNNNLQNSPTTNFNFHQSQFQSKLPNNTKQPTISSHTIKITRRTNQYHNITLLIKLPKFKFQISQQNCSQMLQNQQTTQCELKSNNKQIN